MQNKQLRRWGETNAPCRGCTERTTIPNCHGQNDDGSYRCELYAAFKATSEHQKKLRTEFIKQNDILTDIHSKRSRRVRSNKYDN